MIGLRIIVVSLLLLEQGQRGVCLENYLEI